MKEISSIVSACLAGVACRYDGKDNYCQKVVDLVKQGKAIPICPEQLGGLPTPRNAAERNGDKVIAKDGKDLTEQFQKGAREALKIAQLVGAKTAILKARSPSCGKDKIYDGTFSKALTDGNGIFAQICQENGIKVITEEELDSIK
jgi:uncharacterized protein YbbK (DUF523 family)